MQCQTQEPQPASAWPCFLRRAHTMPTSSKFVSRQPQAYASCCDGQMPHDPTACAAHKTQLTAHKTQLLMLRTRPKSHVKGVQRVVFVRAPSSIKALWPNPNGLPPLSSLRRAFLVRGGGPSHAPCRSPTSFCMARQPSAVLPAWHATRPALSRHCFQA